jgi:alkylated DNA nucleotide flippase Atl1
VWKKDPRLEDAQRERLAAEGIETVDGRVDMARFGWIPDGPPII